MERILINLIGGRPNEQGTLIYKSLEDISDENDLDLNASDGDEYHVMFEYRGKTIKAGGTDYFEAFCRIREALANENLIPHCYAASLNVMPSGMARDMGLGLRAYRMTMGIPAMPEDLVNIFETGPDVIPASVAEQTQFFKDWIGS